MKIFANVSVVGDKIKIRFDFIAEVTLVSSVLGARLHEFYKRIKEIYRYCDSDVLQKELAEKTRPIESFHFENDPKSCDGDDIYYAWEVIEFDLPTTPNYALNFLTELNEYFKGLNVVFLDDIIDDHIDEKGKQKTLKINELKISSPHATFQDGLIAAIGKTVVTPIYHPVKEAINKEAAYCKQGNKSLTSIKERLQLLYPELMQVFDEKVDSRDKLYLLVNTASRLIGLNQKAELNYVLNMVSHHAKYKLFEACIGKEADDKGNYSWTYTEWEFLRFANFRLRVDGRLSIKDHLNNFMYKRHYAREQRNHKIFEREMRHLGHIIGLEFAPCDFHKEIIFTEACTKQLMAKGLHFHVDYVRQLLQEKVNWQKIFAPGIKYLVNANKEVSLFSQLPLDVINMISSKLQKPDPVVDKSELSQMGLWARQLKPKTITLTETEEITSIRSRVC